MFDTELCSQSSLAPLVSSVPVPSLTSITTSAFKGYSDTILSSLASSMPISCFFSPPDLFCSTFDSSFPRLRRKKLPWTKEEEETLKRFSDAAEKWKTILEFGSNVFIKGRTTIDLKDKWRNICKRSPTWPK